MSPPCPLTPPLRASQVAVHSDADRKALHVRMAHRAVSLGGETPAQSYLRQDAIIEAALASGAEAIHPGYGFLSENAEFARRVEEAGLGGVVAEPGGGSLPLFD